MSGDKKMALAFPYLEKVAWESVTIVCVRPCVTDIHDVMNLKTTRLNLNPYLQ